MPLSFETNTTKKGDETMASTKKLRKLRAEYLAACEKNSSTNVVALRMAVSGGDRCQASIGEDPSYEGLMERIYDGKTSEFTCGTCGKKFEVWEAEKDMVYSIEYEKGPAKPCEVCGKVKYDGENHDEYFSGQTCECPETLCSVQFRCDCCGHFEEDNPCPQHSRFEDAENERRPVDEEDVWCSYYATEDGFCSSGEASLLAWKIFLRDNPHLKLEVV